MGGFSLCWPKHDTEIRRQKAEGSRQDLRQRRKVAKVAKQAKDFLLSGLCALASLREAVDLFTLSYLWEAPPAPISESFRGAHPTHPRPSWPTARQAVHARRDPSLWPHRGQ